MEKSPAMKWMHTCKPLKPLQSFIAHRQDQLGIWISKVLLYLSTGDHIG